MVSHANYKYRFRPSEHDSNTFLIEFLQGDGDEDFGKHLLEVIQELNPKLEEEENLWMNDESVFRFASNAGSFIISSDAWTTFIFCEDNPHTILLIHELLAHHERFEHID